MNKEQKIQLADKVIQFIKDCATSEDVPVFIGTLKKKQGFAGFLPADIGHPVFEYKDRYLFYLDSINGKIKDAEFRYYKESLSPFIYFNSSSTIV